MKHAEHLALSHRVFQYSSKGFTVSDKQEAFTKAQELRGFLLLTAVIAPAATGAIVAGYGFLVWMFQLFAGPPGS
jgi:nitrate reductase NapE